MAALVELRGVMGRMIDHAVLSPSSFPLPGTDAVLDSIIMLLRDAFAYLPPPPSHSQVNTAPQHILPGSYVHSRVPKRAQIESEGFSSSSSTSTTTSSSSSSSASASSFVSGSDTRQRDAGLAYYSSPSVQPIPDAPRR